MRSASMMPSFAVCAILSAAENIRVATIISTVPSTRPYSWAPIRSACSCDCGTAVTSVAAARPIFSAARSIASDCRCIADSPLDIALIATSHLLNPEEHDPGIMHRSGTVGRHARACGALALLGQSLGANDRNFSVGPKIPRIKDAAARSPPSQCPKRPLQ